MVNEGKAAVLLAVLFFAAIGLAGFTVKAQEGSVVSGGMVQEPLVGGSCGTVSPDGRDECCARQNEGRPQIMCVGYWEYDYEAGCRFVCGVRE